MGSEALVFDRVETERPLIQPDDLTCAAQIKVTGSLTVTRIVVLIRIFTRSALSMVM